ncbi:MAG: FAD-dependent oxidoreductase, partial [Balneolaceae bacterium]
MIHYDVVIFGAGLAGLSAANYLLKERNRILLIDPQSSPLGTDFPGGLVNPATGKRATPGWRGQTCYKKLRSHIETLSNLNNGPPLYMDSGVLRPALTEKLAENFAKTLQVHDWPDGWLQWIDADQIARDYPYIAPSHGGLQIQAGYTVYVDRYLSTYRNWLKE